MTAPNRARPPSPDRSPTLRTPPPRARVWIGVCIGACVGTPTLLALIGCAGGTAPPTIEQAPYAGPPVTLDTSGREHVAVFSSPTAGFSPTLDHADLGFRTRVAYVTLRRPDPAFVFPQAVVDQRVALGVDAREPIRLYVRLIDAAETPARQPYALAATSPGRSGPAAQPETPAPATSDSP